MDFLDFDTREKYIAFLERLASYCDTVAIAKEDDEFTYSQFIERITPYMKESKWVRKFPGIEIGGKIRCFPMSRQVVSEFKKYDSFLTVGLNESTGFGLDMAFFKDKNLVFNVFRHLDMCHLSSKHEPFFEDVLQGYGIGEVEVINNSDCIIEITDEEISKSLIALAFASVEIQNGDSNFSLNSVFTEEFILKQIDESELFYESVQVFRKHEKPLVIYDKNSDKYEVLFFVKNNSSGDICTELVYIQKDSGGKFRISDIKYER